MLHSPCTAPASSCLPEVDLSYSNGLKARPRLLGPENDPDLTMKDTTNLCAKFPFPQCPALNWVQDLHLPCKLTVSRITWLISVFTQWHSGVFLELAFKF